MKSKNHRSKKGHAHFKRRTAPGASPGSVVVDPAATPTHLRIMRYGASHFEELANASLADVKASLETSGVVWVNVEGLGNANTIEAFGELFHLHRLALEDVVNVHQRAKMEEYGEHLYFVAPMAANGFPFVAEQVSLFLGARFVLTFQEGQPGDAFDAVRARLRSGTGKLRGSGADYLAYALIDALIDSYFPVLEKYGERLDLLEDAMVADRQNRMKIDELHSIRGDLRQMRRAIWPQREALAGLLRESTIHFSDSTRIYLRDCYDHVVQLIDLLETYRELTADLRDLYMSTVSNRINETMRVLTIISTIFIPLTFIAGVYGMNFNPAVSVWNMPELNWRYGYPFSLVMMAVSAVLLTCYFIRMGWIYFGRND